MITSPASLRLSGIHHVSAISAHIGRTHDFYTRVLGLRPVIRTVNQDDTSMYHLFFGDGAGSPGSDMTVFDIRGAAREHRGNNSITRTNFRVGAGDTLAWWAARFEELGVSHAPTTMRAGRRVLDFDDADGTPHTLVDDGGEGEAFPWDQSAVPPEHQIRGLGYPEITVPVLGPTHRFHVLFELATDGPGFEIDGPLDGERLSLPPFLEPRRAEIEAKLRPLSASSAADGLARAET